jgi:hypothetical protein
MKTPINNFVKIAGVPEPSVNTISAMNAIWCLVALSSEMRTFFFKYHHNTLGLNYRVNHINLDRDSSCTFCLIKKNLPSERETF